MADHRYLYSGEENNILNMINSRDFKVTRIGKDMVDLTILRSHVQIQ